MCLEDINRYRLEFGKAYNRCTAARKSRAGVLNAVRCTGYCRKDFTYCWRHSLQDEAYKNGASHAKRVVQFEEASTSETLSSSACSSLDGVTHLHLGAKKHDYLAVGVAYMSAVDDAEEQFVTVR